MFPGELLPCGTDGVDLVAIFLGIRIIDDEHLGTQAFRGGLGRALPLAVDVGDTEAIGKTRRDFAIEEGAPGGFASSLLGMVGRTQTKIELSVYPALGTSGVGWIASQSGSSGISRDRSRAMSGAAGEGESQPQNENRQKATKPLILRAAGLGSG